MDLRSESESLVHVTMMWHGFICAANASRVTPGLTGAVQSVASSLLIGLIFVQLERNMSSLQPRLFSSFLLVFAQFLFALLGVVNAFPAERAVFLRETQDKLYHPAAFYLAKVMIDTMMQSFFPILVVAISYPLIGLNGESAVRVLWFYAP